MPIGVMPQRKQKLGRPTLFTPQHVARYLDAARLPIPKKDAAALAGWSVPQSIDYIKLGRAQLERRRAGEKLTVRQRDFADFAERLEQQEAVIVQSLLASVISASRQPSTWQAAWKLLSKLRAEDYSDRIEISGPGGEPIPIEARLGDIEGSLRDFLSGAVAGQQVDRSTK